MKLNRRRGLFKTSFTATLGYYAAQAAFGAALAAIILILASFK